MSSSYLSPQKCSSLTIFFVGPDSKVGSACASGAVDLGSIRGPVTPPESFIGGTWVGGRFSICFGCFFTPNIFPNPCGRVTHLKIYIKTS